jgi:GNAT superfamily N-acetyltransferase
MENRVSIREFSSQDRESIRRISCETAFLGIEGEKALLDDEILADALTIYFTDYEPQSCFVAEADNKVIGYILGSKDVKRMEHVSNYRIMPGLVIKALKRGFFFKKKNLKFFWYFLVSLIKGEFYAPDFCKEFPATLHVNLDKDFRGSRIGSRLIERTLHYFKEKQITGVHFGTLSDGANIFFSKMGFDLLFQGKRSYLRHYLGRDLKFYIFGKKL